MNDGMRACAAEFFATFGLLFIGVGSIAANAAMGGAAGLTAIAFAHGLAIAIGVAFTGHISGAHINPAVTLGMLAARRVSVKRAVGYILAQLGGGIAGGWALGMLLPLSLLTQVKFGIPALGNGITEGAAIALEAIMTAFLMLAIFGSAIDPRGPKAIATFAIGFAVTMNIFLGAPFTGAALNPARFVGSAFASGTWDHCSVYWIGPIIGAVIAALLYKKVLLKR